MTPDRKPPSLLVECCIDPTSVLGSTIVEDGAGAFLVVPVVLAAVRVREAAVLGLAVLVVRRVVVARDLAAALVFLAVAVDRVAGLRAAVDFLAALARLAAVPVVFFAAAVVLRAVVDLGLAARALVVERERLDADAVLRVVPARDVVVFLAAGFLVVDDDEDVRLAAVVDVVMTFAAAFIALAASAIDLVAVVIALVMAVMALADEDALVATDFICVAAALAWDAALVTLVAAAVVLRLDVDVVRAVVRVAGFLAALVLRAEPVVFFAAVVRLAPVALDVRAVARAVLLLVAALVRLAAVVFLAVVDFFAVLFARLAVPRLDVVRGVVLVGTDLPLVMISYGEIYSTLSDALHTHCRSWVRRPPDATRSSSPETRSSGPFRARSSSRPRSAAAPA
ncbi:hypothetical protein [Spirillospora sp. CA-294931]|uniref:hypothetical protein n=1 Tax=Spirillospora sp. CA-294931 TaxID=3240042 RepID=UPI003D91F381